MISVPNRVVDRGGLLVGDERGRRHITRGNIAASRRYGDVLTPADLARPERPTSRCHGLIPKGRDDLSRGPGAPNFEAGN